MTRLVVKSHRPMQWALAVIMLSMGIAILTWLLLDNSHWSLIYDRIGKNQDYKLLQEVNSSLKDENKHLLERVLMLERLEKLDKQTAALLHNEMIGLQDEIYRLKGELEFYQGIMDATADTSGLNVHGIHIDPLKQEKNYRLKLILTHVTKSDKVAEGVMEVSIEGIQNGVSRQISLKEISSGDSLELNFKFRNFKRFESTLVLPDGFDPRKVLVNLKLKGKKQAKIIKVFDWPTATS